MNWLAIRTVMPQFGTLVSLRFILRLDHGGLFVLGRMGWFDAEDIVLA